MWYQRISSLLLLLWSFAGHAATPVDQTGYGRVAAALTLSDLFQENQTIEWLSELSSAIEPVPALPPIAMQPAPSPDFLTPETWTWLAAHRSLRVVIAPEFDENGQFQALSEAYFQRLEALLMIRLQRVKATSWAEAMTWLQSGQADLVGLATQSPPAGELLKATQPYLALPVYVLSRTDSPGTGDLSTLSGKKVGVAQQAELRAYVAQQYPKLNLISFATAKQNLQALAFGQVEAALVDLHTATTLVSQLGLRNLRMAEATGYVYQLRLGGRPDRANLVQIFDQALWHLNAQPVVPGRGLAPPATPRLLVLVLVVGGIFISAAVTWNITLRRRIEQNRLAFEAERVQRREMLLQLRKLSRAVEQIDSIIIITDLQGQIEFVNPAFTKYTGYSWPEAIGKTPHLLSAQQTPSEVYRQLWQTIKQGKSWQGEIYNCKKNGVLFWVFLKISLIRQSDGKITHYLAIEEDISERKQALLALNAAKDHAEAANHAKTEFIANMSHELRTPLNAIIGFTELLRQEIIVPHHADYLTIVHHNSLSLLTLLNDILDLSKIEAGKLELRYQTVSLARFFQELFLIFSQKIQEKGLHFELKVAPDLPSKLFLEDVRLRQIILNLLGNAVKFTAQGQIVLHAYCKNTRFSMSNQGLTDFFIEVIDTGIGIPEGQRALLFDAFAQCQGPDNIKYGGAGLGLAIAKRLLDRMGGRIQVHSVFGQGSTFRLELPDVRVPGGDAGPWQPPVLALSATTSPPLATAATPPGLTPDRRAQLRGLLEILQNSQRSDWEKLSATSTINDIEAFGIKISQLGQEYQEESCLVWGDQLHQAALHFDMPVLQSLLGVFPTLLTDLAHQLDAPAESAPLS